MRRLFENISCWWRTRIGDPILDFFYDYHDNGVAVPGFSSYSEFQYGKLALLISILTIIGLILYIILT